MLDVQNGTLGNVNPHRGPGNLHPVKVGDRLVLVTTWEGGGVTAQEALVEKVLSSTCRVKGERSPIHLRSGRVRFRREWGGVFRKEAYLPSAWGSKPYLRLDADEAYKDNLRRAIRWAVDRADLSMLTRLGQVLGIKFDGGP